MTKVKEEKIMKDTQTEETAGVEKDESPDKNQANPPEEEQENASAEKTEESQQDSGNEAGTDSKEEGEEGDAKYLRLMADFQNYKRRVEKEKSDIYSYANENLIKELLTVLDNFERALEQEGSGDGFKEGMDMIFKQLCGVLEKSGLVEIPALGEDFDPNFHNAVMTEETKEYDSGKVSGVMQKGYTLNGKVIRPTMVKVAG